MSNLYVFGSGDCGQLGLGEDVDLKTKPYIHPFFKDKALKEISAGGLHTLALSKDGNYIWSWGCNDEQALGHQAPEYTISSVKFPSSSLLSPSSSQSSQSDSHLMMDKIIHVAAGDSLSAALTEKGVLYVWGTFRDSSGVLGFSHQKTELVKKSGLSSNSSLNASRDEMDKMEGKDGNGIAIKSDNESSTLPLNHSPSIQSTPKPILTGIVKVSAGANHLVALTQDGQVYSWGCGEQGRLGRRVLERHKIEAGLRPINVTPRLGRGKDKIISVACGSYHTIMIGESGIVWSMGLNNYGQLGLGDYEDRILPEPIRDLKDDHNSSSSDSTASLIPSSGNTFIGATAGEHHTLLLDKNGNVWSFGRGDFGQLGIKLDEERGERAINRPTRIPSLSHSNGIIIKQITTGGNHNMALDGQNRVFVWGYGGMHQLGLGEDDNDHFEPISLKLVGQFPIQKISAGGQHSVILQSQSNKL